MNVENIMYKTMTESDKNIMFAFVEWCSRHSYTKQEIYEKYTRDRSDNTYIPDYDTFVCEKWCNEPIDQIMADNDNEELEWCLEHSYTNDELFELFLKNK